MRDVILATEFKLRTSAGERVVRFNPFSDHEFTAWKVEKDMIYLINSEAKYELRFHQGKFQCVSEGGGIDLVPIDPEPLKEYFTPSGKYESLVPEREEETPEAAKDDSDVIVISKQIFEKYPHMENSMKIAKCLEKAFEAGYQYVIVTTAPKTEAQIDAIYECLKRQKKTVGGVFENRHNKWHLFGMTFTTYTRIKKQLKKIGMNFYGNFAAAAKRDNLLEVFLEDEEVKANG